MVLGFALPLRTCRRGFPKGERASKKEQIEDSGDLDAPLHSHYNSFFLEPLSPRKGEWGGKREEHDNIDDIEKHIKAYEETISSVH